MTAGSPIVVLTKPVQFHNRVRLQNQIPSYNPTRVGMKGPPSKNDVVSEYQWLIQWKSTQDEVNGVLRRIGNISAIRDEIKAYKKWPFQRPPCSIRPELRRMEVRVNMESSTTYKKDFVGHQNKKDAKKEPQKKEKKVMDNEPPKVEMYTKTTYNQDFAAKKMDKTESFKPKYEYNMSKTKFKGQSIYQVSYQEYNKEVAAKCRPAAMKPQENLEVPKKNVQFELESTAKNDYQKPEMPETIKPIIPVETKHIAEGPMDTTTMYQQYYTYKTTPQEFSHVHHPPATKQYTRYPMNHTEFNGITTFMADFKPHYNVSRQPCCKPVESDQQFVDAPFEGQTTQRMAYKPWPVEPPKKPIWALKRPYKRSTQEVPMNSTYTVDFKDPGVIRPLTPIKPKEERDDIIKHGSGDGNLEASTTYQNNFTEWKGSHPAKSFRVKQEYVSPNEAMTCESTQRSHYKGAQTEKAELCRKISEHRELNTDKRMYFNTTYRDTYTDNRPKSCPASLQLLRKSPSVFKAKEASKCKECKSKEDLESPMDSGTDTMASSGKDDGKEN